MFVNYYHTDVLRLAGLEKQIDRVVEYAVKYQDRILISEEVFKILTDSNRTLLNTPMADVFDRMTVEYPSYICPVYLQETGGVPEILTAPGLVVDFKQAQNHAHQSVASIRDKILVNLTSALRINRTTARLEISDLDTLFSNYTRALFVASYNDLQQGWVPSAVADFLIKSYSIIISSLISVRYQCSFAEQSTIGALCALFFSNRMIDTGFDGSLINPMYYRATYFGTRAELERIAGEVNCISQDFNLDKLASSIAQLVGGRLSAFNRLTLCTIAGNLGGDSVTSILALEYPPYWAHLILQSVSGRKLAITYQLNHNRLTNDSRNNFIGPLLKHQPLFMLKR